MFAVSYGNTERSVLKRMAADLAVAKSTKREALRIAWEAKMQLVEAESVRRRERNEAIAAAVAEMRAQGIRYRHTYGRIEAKAIKLFKVSKTEIHSERRQRQVVFVRQFVMYWACRLTVHSLPRIGQMIGGRDHTTVLHGKRAYVEKRAAMGRTIRSLDQ